MTATRKNNQPPTGEAPTSGRTIGAAQIVGHYGIEVEVRFPDGSRSRIRIRRNAGYVVGDTVELTDAGLRRLPRTNCLQKSDRRGHARAMAANLDVLGIIVAPRPVSPRGFVDRAIVSARSAGIRPLLIVNKLDLEGADTLREKFEAHYGNAVFLQAVSAKTGANLDALREFFAPGLRGAFIGTTGTGKTSLLNRLCPGLELPVGELDKRYGRGRHTTTTATLHALPSGGALIDTPGFRDFRPSEISPQDLALHFPGLESVRNVACQFGNCLHQSEPGCQVRAAAEEGRVSEQRYRAYLEWLTELTHSNPKRRGRA